MGNQESLMYKNTVYEDDGKYIIPTKIKAPQSTEETQIIKNIFGVNDPALLTRSYWAKNPNLKANSLQRKLSKSPTRSRKLLDSSVGVISRHQANDWARQSAVRPERQILGKSIVSNFRQDFKETPSRTLSKITSCSIISKLNQFDPDPQQTSALRFNQKPSIANIFYDKNKQNAAIDLSGSQIKSSKRIRKTQGVQNVVLQKSRIKFNRQIQINDHRQSQVRKIFGASYVSEQDQSRFGENYKLVQKERQEENIVNNNRFQSKQNRQRMEVNYRDDQKSQVGMNQELCEQTFSRFEQNPGLLCSSLHDKASQKQKNFDILSKKTNSKHSEIQKFDGLNQDSKNQSLMKVLKRITQISIDNSALANKQSNQVRNLPIRQSVSQIMNQNINQRYQLASKKSEKSKTLKSQSTQKYEQPPFQLYLHQVKNNPSQKSSNIDKSVSKKSSSNFSQNQSNLIYSEAAKANSKSLSKLSIYNLTETYKKNHHLLQDGDYNRFEYLDNEESHQTEEKIESSNDDYFKCSKLKSPKSITSEQVGLTRQRSCAGRIVQTSKAVNNNEYSSPFKSKKYDFSKKSVSRHENSSSKYSCGKKQPSYQQKSPRQLSYAQIYKKSPSQKSVSRKSPSQQSNSKVLDYKLMMKIQNLEGELQSIKQKQELQKFESRRYSPVKQEKSKRKLPFNQQDISLIQNEQEEPKYCINELSKCIPSKHRAQYFKLKLR